MRGTQRIVRQKPRAVEKKSVWPRVKEIADAVARAVLVVAAIIILISAFITSRRNDVLIEVASVPDTLEKAGYTKNAVAAQFISEIRAVPAEARTSSSRTELALPESNPIAAVEIPEVKLSYSTLVQLFREILGHKDKTVRLALLSHGDAMTLTAEFEGASAQFSGDAANVSDLLRQAAHFTLQRVDPYVEAAYAAATMTDENEKVEKIRQCFVSRTCDTTCRSMAETLWGTVLSDRNDSAGAIDHYNKALALDAKNQFALLNIGGEYLKLNQPAAAEKYIKRALKVDDDNPSAHVQYARILRTKDKRAALAEFQRAVELARDDAMPHAALALTYLHDWSSRPKAEEEIRLAFAAEPSNAIYYYIWAAQMRQRKELGEAQTLIDKALQLDPKSVRANEIACDIAIDKQDWPRAQQLATSLATLAPNDPRALLYTAYSAQMRGDAAAAAASAREVMQRFPAYTPARDLVAELQATTGSGTK